MTEELEALRYVAQQQNVMDVITRRVYGPNAKYERLSAFGQRTIEDLARKSNLLDPPQQSTAAEENVKLRATVRDISEKLAAALRENEDLWHENEDYKLAALELEDL